MEEPLSQDDRAERDRMEAQRRTEAYGLISSN